VSVRSGELQSADAGPAPRKLSVNSGIPSFAVRTVCAAAHNVSYAPQPARVTM